MTHSNFLSTLSLHEPGWKPLRTSVLLRSSVSLVIASIMANRAARLPMLWSRDNWTYDALATTRSLCVNRPLTQPAWLKSGQGTNLSAKYRIVQNESRRRKKG